MPPNNQNNNQQPLPPVSPMQQGTNQPLQTQPVVPGSPEGNNKKILIIVGIVTLLIVIIGVMFVLLTGSKDDKKSQATVPVDVKPAEAEVLKKLDEKYKQYSINEANLGKTSKPLLYTSFDQSAAYFMSEPDEWRVYKYDISQDYTDVHGAFSSGYDECERFLTNNQTYITTIINSFKESGFDFKQPKNREGKPEYFKQSPDCHQGAMFVSDSMICSAKFDVGNYIDKGNNLGSASLAARIGCKKADSLKQDIENAKISKQIEKDTNPDYYDALITLPEYAKNSQTTGYKIAEIQSESGTYFYLKKDSSPWVLADSNSVGLLCETVEKSPEIKQAFKGEKCMYGSDPSSLQEKIIE